LFSVSGTLPFTGIAPSNTVDTCEQLNGGYGYEGQYINEEFCEEFQVGWSYTFDERANA
jgi:hypothetical protein